MSTAVLGKLDETVLQANILSGAERNVDRLLNFFNEFRILPRHHIFKPRDVALFERFAETNARLHSNMITFCETTQLLFAAAESCLTRTKSPVICPLNARPLYEQCSDDGSAYRT